MEVPMTNKPGNRTKSDVALLASWRQWLSALEAEMSATNERDEKRRHVRVEAIQHTITKTPSQGIEGIGVKLALANFLDGFADGAESAVSAYLDTVRMLDRDFFAEAEAVIERAKTADQQAKRADQRVFARGRPAQRSRQVERSS
jgi:hypothetical protein